MTIRQLTVLVFLGAVGLVEPVAASPPYTFTTIDVPGANPPYGTQAYGINNAGQIVGFYSTEIAGGTGFFAHGYLYTGGSFTPIDVPGSHVTEAYGINDAGQIVGIGDIRGQGHGFLYTSGSFTDIGVNSAYGINNAGQIVGTFGDASGNHGFLYTGGIYTTIDVPGATDLTQPQDINNAGQIVGTFRDNAGEHGFLYTGGIYTTIDAPGAHFTEAVGINDAGQILVLSSVGNFLYTGGSFTPISVPGTARGINNAGQIVGSFYDSAGQHGFLATPVALVFAGTPGFSNCHGQSVAALARQFKGLNAAAADLGFASVGALQNAILSFCGG